MINIGSITQTKATINKLHMIMQDISKATEIIVTINPKKASNSSFISLYKYIPPFFPVESTEIFENVIINITPRLRRSCDISNLNSSSVQESFNEIFVRSMITTYCFRIAELSN